jgi:two-component system chemotaxis response regulator CheB
MPAVSMPSPPVDALPGARPVRVLVIDDSPVMRGLLCELLSADPALEVVGTAADAYIARDKIKRLAPDVLTLDVQMPRMDGLAFLSNLMRLRPMPVVMVSTLTAAGADVTLEALARGAVDFIAKPRLHAGDDVAIYAGELSAKIRQAARATVAARGTETAPLVPAEYRSAGRLLAIGASIGGTEAICRVLSQLPADAPATVVAQHIPAAFSTAFAQRLDRHSAMTVCEVRGRQPLLPGHVYVAPGGRHLRVRRSGGSLHCVLDDSPPVNRHRPSIDVLFESIAEHASAITSAALLTGMGDDGAKGLLALRHGGAATFVQDAATSVVWGMPGAAVALGAAQEVLPLSRIAARLLASTLRDGHSDQHTAKEARAARRYRSKTDAAMED